MRIKIKSFDKTNQNEFGLSIMNPYECDERTNYNLVHVKLFKYSLWLEIPQVLKPRKRKVTAVSWNEDYIKRVGRDWYYEYIRNEYGFSINAGALHIRYGQQTWQHGGDHETSSRSKCFFYPWEWCMVRHEVLSLDQKSKRWNANRKSFIDDDDTEWGKEDCKKYQIKDREEAWNFVPFEGVYAFAEAIDPYDGEVIPVKLKIEEREWRRGSKWPWKLLHFIPGLKIVTRKLDIEFKSEIGSRKGSWKGGLMGTSINMLDGETWEVAWKRFQETRLKDEARS